MLLSAIKQEPHHISLRRNWHLEHTFIAADGDVTEESTLGDSREARQEEVKPVFRQECKITTVS